MSKAKCVCVRAWGRMEPAYYEDGQVHVYDSFAEYYTTCHSLTPAQIKRVKAKANRDKQA